MEILNYQLVYIYLKLLDGESLSGPEETKWKAWHAAHPGQEVAVLLSEELQFCKMVRAHQVATQAAFLQRLAAEVNRSPQRPAPVLRRLTMRPLFRVAAILLVVVGLGTLAYYYIGGRATNGPAREQIVARIVQALPDKDIAVQLADGRILVVDKGQPGLIAQLADQRIALENNELVFDAAAAARSDERIQAVHTPAGRPIWVRLPDNSRVYLNAVSQLQFPTAFAPQQRRVQFTGQAYFDIAKKKEAPFYAVSGPDSIEATGTQFSVRAYTGEAYKDVVLLSGSVVVHHASRALRQPPHEVLRLYPNGGYAVLPKDPYELVAFKDDHFYYDSSRLGTILTDLSRWYHVPLVHNDLLEQQGYYRLDTLSRQTPLPTILGLLESTRRVRFGKDKNKIEVVR